MHCECCVTCHHQTVNNISIWLPGQCSTPVKIVKHKHGKALKSGEKTIVLNVFNKFKRTYYLSKSASLTKVKEYGIAAL